MNLNQYNPYDTYPRNQGQQYSPYQQHPPYDGYSIPSSQEAHQSLLSKAKIKQLALVFGHCTAGGAYIPALSDYSVIVRGTGAVFLGGPPLVKAATGEIVTADELGGCDLHTQVSGTCDYPAADEDEAITIGREIVAHWERAKKWSDAE